MSPAPGWYADPYEQAAFRYWDGALWTGHTSGAATAPTAAPTASQATAASPAAPPTQPAEPAPAPQAPRHREEFARGLVTSRLRNTRTLIVFLGAFAVLVIGGALLMTALGRGEPATDCPKGRVCSDPPIGDPLVSFNLLRNEAVGYSFEYDDTDWKVASQEGGEVVLDAKNFDTRVIIFGAPSAEMDAQAVADELEGRINLTGLAEDTDAADLIHGANLGYVSGIGTAYEGGLDTPQGVVPGSAVVMAAERDGVSAGVLVLTLEPRADSGGGPDYKDATYGRIDSLINSFSFAGGAA